LENDYPNAPGSSPFKHLKDVLGSSKSSNNQVAVPPRKKGITWIELSDSASEIEDHGNENTESEDHNSNQNQEVLGKRKKEDDTNVTAVQLL
jgi:hypothetical protein